MARCAVVEIDTNTVINIINADPTDIPPENTYLVEIKKIPVDISLLPGIDPNHPLVKEGIEPPAHIGSKWTGAEFIEVK